MSLQVISREEAREALGVAALRQEESALARCYLQLHDAVQRVASCDRSGCSPALVGAIEQLTLFL